MLRWMLAMMLCMIGEVSAAGETFRCGNWIVSADVSVAELLKKCGEPTDRQVTTQDVRAFNPAGNSVRVGTTTAEVWTYDRGSRALPMIVRIVDGKIDSMAHR